MSHTPFSFKVDTNLPYDKLFPVTLKTKGEKIQSYFWIWFEFAAIAMQHDVSLWKLTWSKLMCNNHAT